MEILRTENLTKTYGMGDTKVTALDNLNLRISKGQFVAIIGSSGSGKSTLLHMLGGVDNPTKGKIYIDDIDISSMNETELAIFRRRKVGIIYQFYNLIPTLNVEKNILLPMLLDGKKPKKEEFDKIIKMLGLNERLNHLPNQLSGGQQQRVAIARALIYRPSIILADEPTGNLDRANTEAILEMLRVSNKEYHQTMILITHDEKIALLADRVITIEDGRIVSDEVIRK
ncbi:ABC transporter ATP-binding protein [Clostridium estertheticum]|uniref:ABC transporter ATP-binding protein n=1 Tax=Clostridium estertheticum TaxID=238834 RepID=UPI001CF31A38|nr:ABC transporter ATP-binding protein [Clostridium estertheticum]MCB2307394.1 ABC transporter ATP-binding protein [Clostridium estertheticum]MCB2345044.1 ABC transporter ATP-binding protein [Clostridium estertheticum]MCB2349796.1 ABC transporter ATP-binding protein [Clostridium estertheticum]WAG48080.1 ABC transporter ATP-binding protein [Clostridium estertheticum]